LQSGNDEVHIGSVGDKNFYLAVSVGNSRTFLHSINKTMKNRRLAKLVLTNQELISMTNDAAVKS